VKVAICREETAGTAEVTPTEYIYTTAESVLNPQMDQDTLRAMGSRGVTFTVDKPYHITGSIPSWAFPVDNGFGPMLYGAMGSATVSAKNGVSSYLHTFSVVDTQVPSFTMWMKTGVYEAKASNCQVNKLTIKNAKASILDYAADIVGSQLVTCTDFGTETYVTGSTKVFRSGGALVFWDDVLALNVDDVSINIDNGIDPNDAKSLGVNYAYHILAGNRTIGGDMTIFVESTTELIDYWGAASGPSLDKEAIPLQFVWESTAIETASVVGVTTKVSGAGVGTLTAGGSYTGTAAHKLFEVKITTAAAADKFKWRSAGSAWSAEVTCTTASITLADGVTVTFSQLTANTLTDRWLFYAGKIPYAFIFYMPACKINKFDQGSTGNRLNAKVSFTAEIGGTGQAFDAKSFLMNTESVAYSAT
jgi:hypothetical protein